jgi:hypothetical protein
MDIKVSCPHCGQHLVVDSAATGQQTSCPSCAHVFTIPAVARVVPSAEPAAVAYVPDPRKRGIAVTSLVLGILSLTCFGMLTGVPAIIFGHSAHGRARKFPAQYAGGGMAMAGFILGYISIPLSLILVTPMFLSVLEAGRDHYEAHVLDSENNLKRIGIAFRVWADDNHDQFSFNVSQRQGGTLELCQRDANGFEINPVPHFMVISNELATPKILYSPRDKTKQSASDFQSLTLTNISYELRTGTNLNPDATTEILAVDPIYGWVLYCDGTVIRDFHYRKKP